MAKFQTSSRNYFFPKLVKYTPENRGVTGALGKAFRKFDLAEAKSRIKMVPRQGGGLRPDYTPSQRYLEMLEKHKKTTSNTYLLTEKF